jgi:phosphatidylglycerophosphate synthase
MRRSSSCYQLWWALLAVIAAVVLSSCRTSSAGHTAIPTLATGTATATVTATSATAVFYATPLATALPTTGWAIYHDPHYPFQLPIPPGWQLHAYSWPQQGAGSCAYYGVGLFPPEVTPVLTPPLSETNPELIDVCRSV